ncbi:hypothetical protein [Rhizobium sp. S163]|uniref:hypothetical protein n=1 Tax=Rhizobium sp. S163 TaxID=3055039 RepID=UPI0025A9E087|nr:hypothetical protein [Rhizobium sp. S163]MDM9645405.1 hypothetical protein [Rhizobium sp. S163]
MHDTALVFERDKVKPLAAKQAVSVAEIVLLRAKLAKEQLGKVRDLMRPASINASRCEFTFASGHR